MLQLQEKRSYDGRLLSPSLSTTDQIIFKLVAYLAVLSLHLSILKPHTNKAGIDRSSAKIRRRVWSAS